MNDKVTNISEYSGKAKIEKNGLEVVNDTIGNVISDHPVANVGLSLGRTINRGNFNSVKFQVSLHIPVADLSEEGLDKAFAVVKDWVDARATEIGAEIDEDL